MLVWLGLTFYISYDNLKLKEFKEFNIHWRAFLVYDSIFKGCLNGSNYDGNTGNRLIIYSNCRTLAFKAEDDYKAKWQKLK